MTDNCSIIILWKRNRPEENVQCDEHRKLLNNNQRRT